MAAIDKIYTTAENRAAFYAWCQAHAPYALKYFYPWPPEWNDGQPHPATNFPQRLDMWLLDYCPLEWVKIYIKQQYGWEDDHARKNPCRARRPRRAERRNRN